MCGGSPSVSAPLPPPKLPEAPVAPVESNRSMSSRNRRRRASKGSRNSTILTSSRGIQDGAATATKTLLGQ